MTDKQMTLEDIEIECKYKLLRLEKSTEYQSLLSSMYKLLNEVKASDEESKHATQDLVYFEHTNYVMFESEAVPLLFILALGKNVTDDDEE